MPNARVWANEFEEGIKAYGFSEDQIHRYTDVDADTMRDTIFRNPNVGMILKKIQQNASQGRRTLLLFFYAGHGATKGGGRTFALLNFKDKNLREYWLEYRLF